MNIIRAILFSSLFILSSCTSTVWTQSSPTKPASRTAIVYYPTSAKPLTRISGKPQLLITANSKNYKLKSGKKLYIPISKSGAVISSFGEDSHAFVKSSVHLSSGNQDVYIRAFNVFSSEVGSVSTVAGTFTGSKITIQFERVAKNTALQEMKLR